MEAPYIKHIANVSGFDVWVVDGKYIRGHIDVEFTNFGQHYRFPFIPKNEFWIDQERVEGEVDFYIEHLLVEHRLMAQGLSYEEAITKASLAERRYRKKVDFIQHPHLSKINKEEYLPQIHKTILPEYSNGIKVWIVDGRIVRGLFFIDFTQGGHDKVYDFVPAGEIWLDDDLVESERKYVLLHELHERALMANGMSYAKAHLDASAIEEFCRQNPGQLQEKLKEAIEKNKLLARNGNGNGANGQKA